MKRKSISINGKTLSYLDNERAGQTMICLHGHFGCGSIFSFMKNVHNGRLILIDQRGHGNSDKCNTYRTIDYVNDLEYFIDHEHIKSPIILGHSLGGVNAYHYAAGNKNVRALIIVDIGTLVNSSNEFIMGFPTEFDSLYEVKKQFEKVGITSDHVFLESLRYDGQVWRFQFDYRDMVISQVEMNGIHWDYWERVDCPILLLHGKKSMACKTENILEMIERNENARLKMYENAGHGIHNELREEFSQDVGEFLRQLTL